jgi:hypothetical protein
MIGKLVKTTTVRMGEPDLLAASRVVAPRAAHRKVSATRSIAGCFRFLHFNQNLDLPLW